MKYKLEFQTADMHKREALGTGIPALDRLLDGGYERGLIHLFYGDSIWRNGADCGFHGAIPSFVMISYELQSGRRYPKRMADWRVLLSSLIAPT